MQVVLPDIETRATFKIQAERPIDNEEYFEFCARIAELRIERDASGEIIIAPAAAFETAYRNTLVGRSVGEVSSTTKSGHR